MIVGTYINKMGNQRITVKRSVGCLYVDIPVFDCSDFKRWVTEILKVNVSDIRHLINFEPQ